jgi:TolB-like protein
LDRILSSPAFQASEKRRAFLRFIVEESLSGRADRLKGYAVAVEVFGRDETFDQQADPVVRLEARRLRRDLDSYYVDAGSNDAVRITVPKGSYVPCFEWREAMRPLTIAEDEQEEATSLLPLPANDVSAQPGGTGRIGGVLTRKVLIASLVTALAAAALIGWALMVGKERFASGNHEPGPAIVVLPFEALSSSENSRYLANGISHELMRNLTQVPGFRVYASLINFDKNVSTKPVEAARILGAAYVISGSVITNDKDMRVMARMFDALTGRVLWSGTYERPLTAEAVMQVQTDLAGKIAAALGQP